MDIKETRSGSALTLALTGRLDTGTSPQLEAQIRQIPEHVAALTLDLTDLCYISSAGLRVLLFAQKMQLARGGHLSLLHPNEFVQDILDVTGLSSILDVK